MIVLNILKVMIINSIPFKIISKTSHFALLLGLVVKLSEK
jgi:hypothetical protein